MKTYQRRAIKLAGEILADLNKTACRICPGCGKPTDEPIGNDGDKYGRVWHSTCFERLINTLKAKEKPHL